MNKHKVPIFSVFFLAAMVFSACTGGSDDETATPMADLVTATSSDGEATPLPAFTPAPCDLPLPGPQDWPVLVCDNFEGTDSVIPDESQDNPYATYAGTNTDGVYQLEYSTKNFAAFTRTALTWFDIANAQDFAMSVTGMMDTTFQEVSWGIGFRASEDKESYFLFSIYNDGTYAFEIYENDRWIPLISRRPFTAISPNQANKITVIAEGQDFSFLINDEGVNFFNGGLLEGLEIFLMVSVREGASATFTFDNVVVQI